MNNPEYRWFTSVRPGISYRPGSEEQVSKSIGDVMNSVQEFSQNNPLAAASALATAFSAAAGAGAWAGIGHLRKLQNQRKPKPEPSDPGPTNQRILGPDDVPTRDVPYLRRDRGPSKPKSVNEEDAQKSLLVSADFLDTSVTRLLKTLSYDQHE